VWGGFAADPVQPLEPLRIEVLVDQSASMQTPMAVGPTRGEVARTAAARFVLGVSDAGTVRLSEIGGAGHCAPPRPIARSESAATRVEMAATLASLEHGGEGSVALALAYMADAIRIRGEPTRVVAFTDLAEACGGDLCAGIADLEAVGASLDLVVIGDAAIPACVAASERAPGPGDLPPTVGARHPTFRVLRAEGGGEVVEGVVGDPPVEVVAEPVLVIVDLDPPLQLGPVRLTPDALTRLEILDFPQLQPRVREWRWEATLRDANPEAP
jgi:hypothetical protein